MFQRRALKMKPPIENIRSAPALADFIVPIRRQTRDKSGKSEAEAFPRPRSRLTSPEAEAYFIVRGYDLGEAEVPKYFRGSASARPASGLGRPWRKLSAFAKS